MSVTKAAIDAARRKAALTGTPAPVVDSSGKVAYYVSPTGSRVGVGDKPSQAPTPDPLSARKKAAEKTAAQQAADKAAAQQAQVASLNQGYAWVDGHRMRVIGQNPDGSLIYTLDNQVNPNTKKPYSYKAPTAYDALDGGNLPSASNQFLFSIGPRIDPATGRVRDAQNFQTASLPSGGSLRDKERALNAQIGRPIPGNNTFDTPEQAALAQRKINDAQGANTMSIGTGLQWLVNLSFKDPGAYKAMLDKLHNAGYLNDSDYATAGGGFSTQVAGAFALAARDVSVINGQGNPLTLDKYLEQRAAGNAAIAAELDAQKQKDYVPVPRSYTDPTAIAAAARDAALSAIGRALTPDEEARLNGHIHSLEVGKYDQIDAAGRAGKNASVVDPNPSGQVDAFLHSGGLEQETANYNVAKYGAALRSMFGLGG